MITLTERAASEVKNILEQNDKLDYGLRVYVAGSGCSGLQYGMGLDELPIEDDQVFESNGVRVFIDNASLPLLTGSTVDFVETAMGTGFKIDNPNAPAGGCGSGCSSGCGSAE
ncbi:MAG: iron-sulfur cluster assembly accessory protein [Armatimonadetes bacterium]|nr:iron-sulfur cluster assembly accessory protein [Armatimonadota bacterium]